MAIATNYFQNFPKFLYGDVYITNILSRAALRNVNTVINSKVYDNYIVKNGETIESVAESYYGSTTYFWIIMIFNNIKNVYQDWPLSQECFDNFIINKYGSLKYALETVWNFVDDYNNIIPQSQWNGDYSNRITIYSYENSLNENKRNIRLLKPEHKSQIVKEFQDIFNS